MLEMLHAVGFASDSDTHDGSSERGAALFYSSSCAWTRPSHVCVIDCSSKGNLRDHFFFPMVQEVNL